MSFFLFQNYHKNLDLQSGHAALKFENHDDCSGFREVILMDLNAWVT